MTRVRHPFVVTVAALLTLPLVAAGQTPARTHEITVDDYLTVFPITDIAVAPNGQRVAYTELRWGEHDEPRQTDLWVVDPAGAKPTRLTFDPASESSPQWSPDGQQLYFVTKRNRGDKKPPYDGSKQVWVMGTQPGEPRPVTRVKGGIDNYQISDDGRSLYYTKDGEEAEKEWKDLRKKYSDIKFGDGPVTYTELWRLDLETWRDEKVVAPQRTILDFRVAQDQSRIAFITSPDGRLISREGKSRVDVYDAKTKEITPLPDKLYRADAPSPHGWVENLAWSSDGKALAWTVDFDGFPGEILVAEWSGETPTVSRLTRPDQVTVAGQLRWVPMTRDLCFIAEQRARRRVVCLADVRGGKQGAARVLTPGDVVVMGYGFTADGKSLGVIRTDPQDAGNIYWVDPQKPDSPARKLTNANPQIDTWKLPQLSLITWKAPDGTEVEGLLELPPDYKKGDPPLPLAVELHGGPTDAALYYLQYWIYGRIIFPARGYALLAPNYRGSTGYGDKFLTDLIGHENDIEVGDILAGVDALVERGIVDPERMGILGWSNGGFLVNCLITKTQRFKAASSGAGVIDQLMQWGLEDTPGHVVNYNRGLPWERAEAYIKASPAYDLGKVTTPTIIHVGEVDDRVPVANSRTLYRALRDYTKVPTVLLVYPGAGHGLTISDHRKGKLDWDLAWFDRYVLGKGGDEGEKAKK